MTRKETTELLTQILMHDRLSDRKYFSREVTLDYGTNHAKRIDVMQFTPKGVTYSSDIEKGIFTCYEIKSCREDLYSGNGLNFFGEKNYIVTTMETYKKLQEDYREGKIEAFLREKHPESSHYYGFIVPVPKRVDLKDTKALYAEYENPTPFQGNPEDWKTYAVVPCREGPRTRSTAELLFCMLRSRNNYANA